MDTHELLIKDIFSFSENLLSLSSSRFLCFSFPSDIFSKSDHSSDSSLLLQSDEFLREVIHSLRDDITLNSFRNTIKNSLLIDLDQILLLSHIAGVLVLLCCSKFRNEIKSLLLSFEHEVLDSSSSNKSLKEDSGSSLLVLLSLVSNLLGVVFILGIVISLEFSVNGSGWSHLDLIDQTCVFFILLSLLLLLLQLSTD